MIEQGQAAPLPPGKPHPFHNHVFIPDQEVWKSVVGKELLYQVSTWGRVRSILRYVSSKDKSRRPKDVRRGGKMLTPTFSEGRLLINIGKVRNAAHLVLEAFVGLCPEGLECCHWDGDVRNNQLANLRWDTHISNMGDMRRHGTGNVGERNHSAKLTKEDVLEARSLYMTGEWSFNRLCAKYDLTVGTIAPLIWGKTWTSPDCFPDGYEKPKKRTREECFHELNAQKRAQKGGA